MLAVGQLPPGRGGDATSAWLDLAPQASVLLESPSELVLGRPVQGAQVVREHCPTSVLRLIHLICRGHGGGDDAKAFATTRARDRIVTVLSGRSAELGEAT